MQCCLQTNVGQYRLHNRTKPMQCCLQTNVGQYRLHNRAKRMQCCLQTNVGQYRLHNRAKRMQCYLQTNVGQYRLHNRTKRMQCCLQTNVGQYQCNVAFSSLPVPQCKSVKTHQLFFPIILQSSLLCSIIYTLLAGTTQRVGQEMWVLGLLLTRGGY